ncbi:MAG: aminopeptidase [Bacteroidales bacterium]|nr:aminopeptidase [Bacteroidales bacterium]
MKKTVILITAFLVMLPGLIVKAQVTTDKAKSDETELLAQKIVNQCANIKEGEFVLIEGGVRELELLEDITINVAKKGAHPLLLIGSDRMTRNYYTEVPEIYDSMPPELALKIYGFIDASIGIAYNEDPDLLADIPAKRFAVINQAAAPATDLFVSRKIKQVGIGNGLYPTEARAKQFGITFKELSDIFWKGMNVDYKVLEATGNEMKKVFEAGNEVHITNPNGTDFKVNISGRKIIVLDGIMSDEDLKEGFTGAQVYLPAGEVVLTPVPGTAEGKIVVASDFGSGVEAKDIILVFQKGKIVSMTAKSGIERLKELYDAFAEGKDEFSFIDIGTNPNVTIIPGSKLACWMPAGMITIGIGNNLFAGGENKSTFGYNFHIPGSTLTVDGKVLVDGGTLVPVTK